MKTLVVQSKKHGTFNVLVDDDIFEKLKTEFKNLKWCIRKCTNRNNLQYFQKRLSNGKLIELHRWILGFPEGYIDHINHDTLDNRKENLRLVSNSQNLLNARVRVDNKSGVKGVCMDKYRKKWEATIKVNYKKIYLGRFEKFEDAVKARKEAEAKCYL